MPTKLGKRQSLSSVNPVVEAFHWSIRILRLQIIPSRDVKVAGLLGPASPVDKKGVSVAETAVGLGGTTQWSVTASFQCRFCCKI